MCSSWKDKKSKSINKSIKYRDTFQKSIKYHDTLKMYQHHDTLVMMYQVSVSRYFSRKVSVSVSWHILKVSYPTLVMYTTPLSSLISSLFLNHYSYAWSYTTFLFLSSFRYTLCLNKSSHLLTLCNFVKS